MQRIFSTIIMACTLAVAAMAVTVNDVSSVFKGDLNIGGDNYANKEIYILPGTTANTITFVLPDFKYGAASLGDIVLVNIPMSSSGRLTLDNATLYIRAISERATISVLNGLKDGGTTYNSDVTASSAQVLLSITAPSLPEPIFVLFSGSKVTNRNYAITNGGFEGFWSNNEAPNWHSFPSATGEYASFVTGNTSQFQKSTEIRPGSTGSQSALLQSNLVLSAKANGNCTNGRINAGDTSADSPSKNYNFSDPSSSGYNTAFVGKPDSLVFWAKYIPADKNPSNSANVARAHVAITQNARYQDPETGTSASVKIADAAINYAATSDMGWQRLSTPFTYTSVDPSTAAYMLITFTTNQTPGGGSTYSEGGLFNKKYHYDNLYLDDVEMIYNHALTSLKMDGSVISFSNGQATSKKTFSDSDYAFAAVTNGKASQSFIGYDVVNNRVLVYVVGDNYSQTSSSYSVYTLQMAKPVSDTYYAYTATTCDNEPYSDDLFSNLTKADTYTKTIPNAAGHDSIITLTLKVLPTYTKTSSATIDMDKSYSWRGHKYEHLTPSVYTYKDELKTKAGCDSVYVLTLTVKAVGYSFAEQMTVCQNEAAQWHGKVLPTAAAGTVTVYDSLQSVYGTDSVYRLMLTVLPAWTKEETKYVNDANLEWHGQTIQGLAQSADPYFFYDSLTAANGCDSVYVLRLYVSDIPITYGEYEIVLCDGERSKYEGVWYSEPFEGDIHLSGTKNIYGGDSIVHLIVTMFPSYTIDENMVITEGEDRTWEWQNLSHLSAGEYELYASYYTDDDCDSTLVLHLIVEAEPIQSGIPNVPQNGQRVQKIIWNGQLFIILEDETIYDILGRKIR